MALTIQVNYLKKLKSHFKVVALKRQKKFVETQRGPVASIFFQGLERADHGIEMVEKSVVSYGSVQMGF